MSPDDPYATRPDPIRSALIEFGTLTTDQKVVALAASLIEAKVITEEQLREVTLRLAQKA